jgi:hypothetical protein
MHIDPAPRFLERNCPLKLCVGENRIHILGIDRLLN